LIVTIDGPAASGKSTTARIVARELGWIYLDTGAMYRALTVKVLKEKKNLNDPEAIGKLAENTKIYFISVNVGIQVFLDGEDVTSDIRFPEIDRAVGPVSEVPKVREVMIELQREMKMKGNLVVEGRDMGTVVFPDANLKFFMIASIEERARRRQKELSEKGIQVSIDNIRAEIEKRDKRDSNRNLSPLVRAKDAIDIDTTRMNIQDQVDLIIKTIQKELKNDHNN
jgi:cytidylate kinase